MRAAGALLTGIPALALAHEEVGQAAGFVAGLAHPVSGLDHVLAMIAVGLWGAVLGPPAIWALPVAFPLAMAVGGLLGLVGLPLPGVEVGIAVSAIVLGVMVIAELRPPLWLTATIVAFFAVFHGHAHGRELPGGVSPLLYSMGFVVATGLLHVIGIGLGAVHRFAVGRWVVRLAGGGIALAGAVFLWWAVA